MNTPSRNNALLLLIVAGPFTVLALGIAIMRAGGIQPVPPKAIAAGALGRANVLLVTISSLRADHLGIYGSEGSLTPSIDDFAKQGLRFERTYAHAPATLPSHRALLTAAYPNRPETGATLAGALKARGYRTGAFVGSAELSAPAGLASAFDRYDDQIPNGTPRNATQVFSAAYEWITAAPSPWFVWVQLDDPSEPYAAPEPFRSQYQSEPYDGEVAYTDGSFGVFVNRLRRVDALTNTVVVIVSDHGESLGEHGERAHGALAYDAALRVPLILWAPPLIAPGVFAETMRLVDVAPTLLDLLGIAGDPLGFVDGRSVRPFLGGVVAFDNRESYFEADGIRGIVRGGQKLIEGPTPEFYDLLADPGEQHNLYQNQREHARELEALLGQIAKSPPAGTRD